jgi:hypothetical protein
MIVFFCEESEVYSLEKRIKKSLNDYKIISICSSLLDHKCIKKYTLPIAVDDVTGRKYLNISEILRDSRQRSERSERGERSERSERGEHISAETDSDTDCEAQQDIHKSESNIVLAPNPMTPELLEFSDVKVGVQSSSTVIKKPCEKDEDHKKESKKLPKISQYVDNDYIQGDLSTD